MADLTFFQDEFDRHATDNALGDPNGVLGYAYLRVSSSGQAEEGRSGLPRQIARVHEAAAREGIKIPWEMVFADDHTGFQFEDRPEFSKLRDEFTRPNRRGNIVVIEYLDRLSRNADWHQGYLLDEMKQHKVQTLFWKGFTSRIERAVMGAISQDGMERSLEIMHEGTLDKARSGRVTAKTPNYGYIFVDAEGKQSLKVKRETYYAPHPEHADIIRLIYQKIGVDGMTCRGLATYLQGRVPPPGKYRHWENRQIALFIRNPVYKGEFVAHRYQHVKVPAKHQRPGEPVRMVSKKVERPKSDWISVPVPPLVSVALWETANATLDKNAQMARRNAKYKFLLTGLVKCAGCGYSYSGGCKTYHRKGGGKTFSRSYRCTGRSNRVPARLEEIGCKQGNVNGDILENAVWHSLCQALLEPDQILSQLDAELQSDEHVRLERQVNNIQRQIRGLDKEDEKLYRAYLADVFDEQEFATRRQALKEHELILREELAKVENQQLTKEQIAADREMILSLAELLRNSGVMINAPFDLKQRIIRMVVDQINLDVNMQQFEVTGHIKETFPLALNQPIVSTLAGRG